MGPLMIECPQVRQPISTGIVTDHATFARTPVFIARAFCPYCRTEHEWFAKDAWVQAPSAKCEAA